MTETLSPLGILGAGAMGAGIAQVAVQTGLDVVLFDTRPEAVRDGAAGIGKRLDREVEKERMSPAEAETAKARLHVASSLADLAACPIVVEAIVEDLEIKRKVFAELEEAVGKDTILATNTSSLSVAAIAAACTHPQRVAGLHFFNPVPLMRLVEVVDAPLSSPDVIERLMVLSRHLRKTPVRVADAPGFLVNLGGRAFTTESLHIHAEGVADPATIDAIMRDCCHFRMGPFELMDLTGIDVNYPASTAIYEGYKHDPRIKTVALHETMFRAGRHGRKTRGGFYTYDENGRAAGNEPAEAPEGPLPETVFVADDHPALIALAQEAGVRLAGSDDGAAPILAAPEGVDCTGYALAHGLDPRRLVAVDVMFDTSKRITLMTAPGADTRALAGAAAVMRAAGRIPSAIGDSAGFVAQRMVAMIVNLCCEIAQINVASPEDVDTALQLGLNYPEGPLAWGDRLGPERVLAIMQAMQSISGSDRYRPSLWLRRRALLERSLTKA